MKKIIILSFVLLSAVSCSDFLEHEPVESISINTQLSTKKGMLQALNGVYYEIRATYFSEVNYTYGDLLGGNLKFSPRSSGSISIAANVQNIYQFDDDTSDSDLSGFYGNCYDVISNINLIIQYVDDLPDATTVEINEIKAEALALRAFTHFQLYKYYAQNYTYTSDASHLGIVYNTAPLKVGTDYPSRKTVAETFVLLEDDINKALAFVQPDQAITSGETVNFINPTAVKTIAAEIALWKNDWQKAYDYSNDIIKNSGISLTPKNELVSNWATSERIWEIGKTVNASPLQSLYNIGLTTYANYVASDDIYTIYTSDDLRKNLFEAKSIKTGTTMVPYNFTKKYTGTTSNLVYRLSLLYFIRAEAALHLGNTSQALADINTVRNRAGLAALNSISIDVLLEEKRKEFVFENQYFFDLMRNHKNIIRNNGCISNNCNPTYPSNKFVAPIPYKSLNINSNMQQNPGY
ncbi:RagB/SusD family nutrient uptake outer membrane protein [Chryseobacterium sp. MYb264]|uniref:RagB/SusD family nutrient uptake outer membrane protein n=1 Tax=Chryseobacterium sp. MYb264 TaxID=2745153 RepID=UPI002E0DF482|nr:RagB/SusD family nutrient uptake outer membrane protein [Chryseobacterium sp. MYb264]